MNFKELMLSHGIRQCQLSKRLNMNRTLVNNWWSGYRRPTLELIVLISDVTDISIDEIVHAFIESSPRIKGNRKRKGEKHENN